MTTEQTVIALRQAISSIEDHRKNFHHVLETEMINDPRLSDEQLLTLKKNRFNHSEVEILSLVNQKTELPYKTLTTQVTFSQGMLSRYITKLLKANLLTKVTLPDNKKAYNLRITATGAILADLHDQLHVKERKLYAAALAQFSEADLATVLAVLKAVGEVRLD